MYRKIHVVYYNLNSLKKIALLLLLPAILLSNVYAQDKNAALFFNTTDYTFNQDKTFLDFQTNSIKDELMLTYGYRASSYKNYSKINFINSISNECAADTGNVTNQLFIYIAGMSVVDDAGNGYLILSDSDSLAYNQMISFEDIANLLSNCQVQHLFLFMDVPYSNIIKKHIKTDNTENLFPNDSIPRAELISSKFKLKASYYFASSDNTVSTIGRSRFSPMSSKLLEAFRNYGNGDDVITMYELNEYMQTLEAIPEMSVFTVHESGGDFLFIVK